MYTDFKYLKKIFLGFFGIFSEFSEFSEFFGGCTRIFLSEQPLAFSKALNYAEGKQCKQAIDLALSHLFEYS